MKIESLGHANLLVHGKQGVVLFDPLLYGIHQEGLYDIFPPRELDLHALPPIDVVVISHAHRDHFDPDSLALLPREIPIIAAADPLLLGCLDGLGFENIAQATNFSPITVGSLTLLPTPSSPGALEHGFVLIEDDVAVWNLVDTFPNREVIARVVALCGGIDLLIAPWQPLQDTTLSSGTPVHFPFGMYERMMATIQQVEPRYFVPGACGFRAVGRAAFTNHLLFPVTRERFLFDLRQAAPKTAETAVFLDAGDALTLETGRILHEKQLSRFCRHERIPDAWRVLEFRPHELGFAVAEHRGVDFSREQCHEALASLFEQTLQQKLHDERARYSWHRRWQVIRQYEVVYHGGERAYWTVDFRETPAVVRTGPSPLALAHTACPASLLVGLIAGTISWDFACMSGELRRYDHTYMFNEAGMSRPTSVSLDDPLAELFSGEQAEEHHLALTIERISQEEFKMSLGACEHDGGESRIDTASVMKDVLQQLGGVDVLRQPDGSAEEV